MRRTTTDSKMDGDTADSTPTIYIKQEPEVNVKVCVVVLLATFEGSLWLGNDDT